MDIGFGAPVAGAWATPRNLTEFGRRAERLGYRSLWAFQRLLIPAGSRMAPVYQSVLDPLVSLGFLAAATSSIRLGVAVVNHPFMSSLLLAKQAATVDVLSGGRLDLGIGSGWLPEEFTGSGASMAHRGARTDEYVAALRALWTSDAGFTGEYYTVADARVSAPPNPLPEIYFGGSSAAALPIAAEFADVYLTWGEPPQAAAAKIDKVREQAAARGRAVRFGIRLHTISRDTSDAAWAVANEMLAGLSDEQIANATALHAKSESEGQRRMTALHGGRVDKLEIYPNLWAGVGLVRGGAGTALVGSHKEVANLIGEYHSLGFDEFILSGYPHLEEAYWFAEGVLPLLSQTATTRQAPGL